MSKWLEGQPGDRAGVKATSQADFKGAELGAAQGGGKGMKNSDRNAELQALDVIDVIVGGEGEESHLRCVVCGCEYNHVERVYCVLGTDAVEGNCVEGLSITRPGTSRRSGICLELTCEDGEHRWRLIIQQHKGIEYVKLEAGNSEEMAKGPAIHRKSTKSVRDWR